MTNLILKLLKGPIKAIVKKKLNEEEIQALVVKRINDKLDIPKLTEIEEAKLINAVYDASRDAILIAIDRI